jgi:hypothetical protein
MWNALRRADADVAHAARIVGARKPRAAEPRARRNDEPFVPHRGID